MQGASGDGAAERRREQAALYGAPLDELTEHIGRRVGLSPRDVASTIGVSFPMFTEVHAGRRVRIGNPLAGAKLAQLRELADHLASGAADPSDIPLTLAQIRASTLTPGPPATAQVSRRTDSAGSPSNSPSGSPSNSPSNSGPVSIDRAGLTHARGLVSRHVRPTAARRWPLLEQLIGTTTYVKHENHCPTGSFKVRGGLTYLGKLAAAGGPRPAGLISATRGNHGQSLAYAGAAHGVPVTIVVPEGNSPDKNASMAALGAQVVVHGADFQVSVEHARELAARRNLEMVPPFHPWLVEGVATYAAELHESVPDLDVIYVPVGMGSGISANIAVRDLLGKSTEIVGVVADGAPAYRLSHEAGRVVTTDSVDTFVDGVAVRTPDPRAVATIVAGVARIVSVSDAQAREAMGAVFRATHNLAEPAGALAVAGALAERDRIAGKTVAVVHTGGNCDAGLLIDALS